MGKIIIEIPNYNNFRQELDVSDKYSYRIAKIIQKELKELQEKTEKQNKIPKELEKKE